MLTKEEHQQLQDRFNEIVEANDSLVSDVARAENGAVTCTQVDELDRISSAFEELKCDLRKLTTPDLTEVRSLMGKNFIGPKAYKTLFGVEVEDIPYLPEGLTLELLNSSCPFDSSKTTKETHLLVFIPAALDGQSFTINDLVERANEYCQERQRQRRTAVCSDAVTRLKGWPLADEASPEGLWALIAKETLPGSTSRSDAQQIKELGKYPNYATATARELVTGVLLKYLLNNERLCSTNAVRCEDRPAAGHRVVVGFRSDGLDVRSCGDKFNSSYHGRAVKTV